MNLTPTTISQQRKFHFIVETRLAFATGDGASPASTQVPPKLPFRELEAFACAFLPVLFAFFGSRVTSDHALGLQLLSQLRVKQHQGARDAETYRIGLSCNPAAIDVREHIERACIVSGDERTFRRNALRRRHKILIERFSVHLEIAAARAKINACDRRLAASGPIKLNFFCHLSFEPRALSFEQSELREA
jgi:hypothetical protein